MKVKELKEKLKKYDDDIDVCLYIKVGEDGDKLRSFKIEDKNNPEDWEYYKTNVHPFEIYEGGGEQELTDKILVLSS